jgi:hypothetical protein
MGSMGFAMTAKLLDFQPIRVVLLILCSYIISSLALGAS